LPIEHKDITDPNIHEVKGASTATSGQVLTATGSGTATFQTPTVYSDVEIGSYRIVNGSSTPTALTVAGTYYTVANTGAGAGSSSVYGVAGVTSVWDAANNRFVFNTLSAGDVLVIHFDVSVVTTTVNTAVDIDLEFGIGGSVVTIPVTTGLNIKTATTTRITGQRTVVIYDSNIKDYPARVKAKADTTGATIVANEFDVVVSRRG
jgi:hypothetical protein